MNRELLKTLISDLDCELVESGCYDARSGWSGTDLYVKRNSDGMFLSEEGLFNHNEPKWATFNISVNGYAHQSKDYDEGYEYVRKAVNGVADNLVKQKETNLYKRCLMNVQEHLSNENIKKLDFEFKKLLELIEKFEDEP